MKVTVITATVGSQYLKECVESVRDQTYDNIQHLILVDGLDKIVDFDFQMKQVENIHPDKMDVVVLPYSTGKDRFNGHRIYAAGSFIAEGDFFLFLDDDNILEPNHIQSLVETVQENDLHWAYSLRKIIDSESNFVCLDDCESLGKWSSILHPDDLFIDVNCYFIKKDIAIQIAPVWYRKFREPGQAEVDRALAYVLMNNNLKYDCTRDYTVKYRVGNTTLSVQSKFFLEGNEKMLEKYSGELPWKQ